MENESPKIDKYLLPGSILLAAVIISTTLIWSKNLPSQGKAQIADQDEEIVIDTGDDPSLGSEDAKVVIVEFSDYQCPFCRTFWRNTLPQLKEKYIDTSKVKFVYRDFPLDFHPAAIISAQAAQCAGDQGRYWEFHDKVFEEQDKQGEGTIAYTADDIKKWAGEINLDLNEFNECIASEKYNEEVKKDYEDGVKYGVSGTPTIFINGRKIVGAQPFENFSAIIEQELQK